MSGQQQQLPLTAAPQASGIAAPAASAGPAPASAPAAAALLLHPPPPPPPATAAPPPPPPPPAAGPLPALGLPAGSSAPAAFPHGDPALNEQEKELKRRLKRLYPAVDEQETPLPRSWSPKDKFSYIGLSQNNLRVHYKGHGKTPKDAASVRATHPIPAACGIYYFEVKIVSKGRDGEYPLEKNGVTDLRKPEETSEDRINVLKSSEDKYHGRKKVIITVDCNLIFLYH